MAECNSNKSEDDDTSKLSKLQTDLNKMKKIAKKLLQQKQENECAISKMKKENKISEQNKDELKQEIEAMKQKMNDLCSELKQGRENDETERANTLRCKMSKMTEMMNKIQIDHETKINEMEEKLAVSLQRTEEITMEHEAQIKEYEERRGNLVFENKRLNGKYDALYTTCNEEQQRSKALMELNEALKRNVMNLHDENDELQENIEKIHEKYVELTHGNTNTNTITITNAKTTKQIRDLHAKTVGFKQSVEGLKHDMSTIVTGFQEELISSAKGLNKLHEHEVMQRQKYTQRIQTLNEEKENILMEYDALNKKCDEIRHKNGEYNSRINQLIKDLNDEKEQKKELKSLLHEIETEFEEYKVKNNAVKEEIETEYGDKERQKEEIFNENLNKILMQNEDILLKYNDLNEKHKAEIDIIMHEKEDILSKYNDLYKVHGETETQLMAKNKEMEQLMCNHENRDEASSPSRRRGTHTPVDGLDLDFSAEIHKQLKDDNVSLENELKEINVENERLKAILAKLQTNKAEMDQIMSRLKKENENGSLKITKYSQSLKVAFTKLKQYKASIAQNQQEKKEINTKYKELKTEYDDLQKKMVQKIKDLQLRINDIKDVNAIKYDAMEQVKIENEDEIKRLMHEWKDINAKYEELNALNTKNEKELNDQNSKYNELKDKYHKMSDIHKGLKEKCRKMKTKMGNDAQVTQDLQQLNALKTQNESDIKRLEQELNNKNTKLKELTEDHASRAQQRQIIQMEYDQMKQENDAFQAKISELEQKHTANTDKLKHKYKAYINKQKKEMSAVNEKLNENTQRLEEKHTQLKEKHDELNKEYENKATMADEYETETNTKYETLKQEFDTAQIDRNAIQKRYQILSNEYEVIKANVDQLTMDKNNAEQRVNDMETAHKDAFVKYKEKAKHVVNKHKINAEKQVNDINTQLNDMTQHRDSIDAQYKALLTQNEEITNNFNSIKQQKEELESQLSSLSSEINQQKQTKSVFEQSISDLNSKLRSNQNDLDKLSKQVISLKQTNDDFENKMRNMTQSELILKGELESHKTKGNKHEQTLNKISSALGECSFFKSDDSMSIIEGVNKLAQNYEDITIKHSETQSSASDAELKMKEQEDKIKRLAVTVRKLQSLRTKLQKSLESTKQKLKESVIKCETYYKSLQTIHSEIQRSLDKWKAFINETVTTEQSMVNYTQNETPNINETDQEYLKRCLADVRSLSMYFIQSLDMYREKHEQHEGATSEMEQSLIEAKASVESLQKELEQANKRIESTDNSQIAKNAHIEKLTETLNHSIDCIKDNWHYDITKADFVDLSVSTRLMLEDRIWCLIRWRHKLPDIPSTPTTTTQSTKDEKKDDKDTNTVTSPSSTEPKKKKYNDEYFWTSQSTYLNKLNVKENEIYLPDFFENKLENQITKNLETKWKAIQRRTDRQIQELKSQKVEEEEAKKAGNDQFKQYKAKAKVILQKQKDELNETQIQIKALEPLQEEVAKLKQQLSSLSTENWAEKYEEIEKELSAQKSDLQNKKLEFAEIQSKLLLKERELSISKEEFEKEKDEIRSEYDTEKTQSKKKYAVKLDDYRQRAREMLEEKDKQLNIARNRLKNARNGAHTPSREMINYDYNLKYDKETQTEYEYEYNDADDYDYEYEEKGHGLKSNVIASTDDLVAALQPPMNATIDEKDKNKKDKDKEMDDAISPSNIAAMARMQTQRDHRIREFQDRLRRLQELLNKSEQEHKNKDSELSYLNAKFEQIKQAQDVKKSADNSEYLKNALLQYFDAKIDINQLVSVVAVGLRFNDDEQKKAKNGKLINAQAGIGGYVKSWWA